MQESKFEKIVGQISMAIIGLTVLACIYATFKLLTV